MNRCTIFAILFQATNLAYNTLAFYIVYNLMMVSILPTLPTFTVLESFGVVFFIHLFIKDLDYIKITECGDKVEVDTFLYIYFRALLTAITTLLTLLVIVLAFLYVYEPSTTLTLGGIRIF